MLPLSSFFRAAMFADSSSFMRPIGKNSCKSYCTSEEVKSLWHRCQAIACICVNTRDQCRQWLLDRQCQQVRFKGNSSSHQANEQHKDSPAIVNKLCIMTNAVKQQSYRNAILIQTQWAGKERQFREMAGYVGALNNTRLSLQGFQARLSKLGSCVRH